MHVTGNGREKGIVEFPETLRCRFNIFDKAFFSKKFKVSLPIARSFRSTFSAKFARSSSAEGHEY